MPRGPRCDEEGRIYHLVARGVNRQDIFLDRRDHFSFLKGMVRASMHDGLRLIAYVLMTNHVHLVALRGRESLGTALKGLLGDHASRFNRRHGRCGHLFQNRFWSRECASLRYLVHLVRYVHENPVRAGMVSHAAAYAHSSHHWFVGSRPPAWSAGDVAIRELGGAGQARRFFADGDDGHDASILEEEEERAREASVPPPIIAESPSSPSLDLEELAARVEGELALARGSLTTRGRVRRVAAGRRRLAVAAVRELGVRPAAVARFLGVSRVQVHRYLASVDPGEREDGGAKKVTLAKR